MTIALAIITLIGQLAPLAAQVAAGTITIDEAKTKAETAYQQFLSDYDALLATETADDKAADTAAGIK